MTEINFKALAAPISKNEIKHKRVQWTDKKTGEQKSYSADFITARTVMNRLDTECNPANWRAEFSNDGLPPKTIRCTLYLRINGEWVGKSDVGTMTDIEPEKGMVSDAFKRAAVHWGIGRELYNEGTADLSDDEPRATPAGQKADTKRTAPTVDDGKGNSPADPRDDGDLNDIVWTRDADTVSRFVDWVRGEKGIDNTPHAVNLICKALGLTSPKGKPQMFKAVLAAEYAGSKDDAIELIRAYESTSDD